MFLFYDKSFFIRTQVVKKLRQIGLFSYKAAMVDYIACINYCFNLK